MVTYAVTLADVACTCLTHNVCYTAVQVHSNNLWFCGCAGKSMNDLFGVDNRMRLEESLHQVSAIRDSDRQRTIVGLTYRVGRHLPGEY